MKNIKDIKFYPISPAETLGTLSIMNIKLRLKKQRVKVLIVYDSNYGNTKKIADAIKGSMPKNVQCIHVSSYNNEMIKDITLLLVGSPTIGGRPTESIQKMIDKMSSDTLKGIHVTSFDTRMKMKIAKLFGWASDRIVAKLTEKGGNALYKPNGFLIKGRQGPLVEGEYERAADWGRELIG